MNRLLECSNESDTNALMEIAHIIKSSSGNFGFDNASYLAQQIEEGIRNKCSDRNYPELVNECAQELEHVREFIAAYIKD